MSRRVDARDVLDANAKTSRALTGRVVGIYRQRGPNAWDDYLLVDEDGGPIEIFAGTPIQIEAEGAIFRMRRKGEVAVVKWTPEGEEGGAAGDLRARFLESCVRPDPTRDGNLAAWLHRELEKKPEPND